MNIAKRKSGIIVVIISAVTLSILVYQYFVYRTRQEPTISPVTALSIPTPTPTVIFLPVSVDSPDGTRTLTMKYQENNTTATYSFFASEKPENLEKLIATKTVPALYTFSIPDNTWSPDNKYAFVTESTPTKKSYFIFPASESLPENNLQNTDVHALFSQKYPQYILTDITGWVAPNLLIMNTTADGGERGPSFWFDITTQVFIQLGTLF